jgi:hypothetical protein
MRMRQPIQLLIISLLVFGLAGGVSMVAAADTSLNPGYGTDPDFFSPTWAPVKYTSYTDPDFLNSTWKPAKITYSFADPGFLSSSWKVSTYKPMGDANFLYSNWSVKTPVLYRYSPTLANTSSLDPFASDAALREQGWQISNTLW